MANLSALRTFKITDLQFKSFKNGFYYNNDSNQESVFYIAGESIGPVTPLVTVTGEDFAYFSNNPGGAGEVPFEGLVTGFQVGAFIGDDYKNYFIASNIRLNIERVGQVANTETLADDFALVKTMLGRADVFSGSDGNDQLGTFKGDDTLIGGKGRDTLDGGGGSDTSSYEFAGKGVRVFLDGAEGGNTGDALGDVFLNIENLTGSRLADALHGDGKANVIIGGAGNDQIWGNGGADTFVFDQPISKTNVDTLRDFEHGADKIKLDDDVFTGITFGKSGQMAARNFWDGGSVAHDADDRIIYNEQTGRLFYDPDGNVSGGVAAKLIAIVSKIGGEYPELSQTDFFRL